ncbi:hypothetical protein N7523_001728 [Penicillium sp. IBT 18751x]|nr:hypothetical protein N7523_001728 [Penicillium sp. IBT 18751x]
MEDAKAAAHVEHQIIVPAQSLGSNTIGVNDEVLLQISEQLADFAGLVEQARQASDFEHKITNREAFKLFPKVFLFSFDLSLTTIIEKYDTSLLGPLYAQPTFQERFEIPVEGGGY